MTVFMAGSNEAHTSKPRSIARSLNGDSLFAIAAVLQNANPGVVPVIAVGDSEYGTAAGAPAAAVVPTGADIVGLFNSAASRAGSLLATTTHADLYRATRRSLRSTAPPNARPPGMPMPPAVAPRGSWAPTSPHSSRSTLPTRRSTASMRPCAPTSPPSAGR
jgi:hypothetical protein